MGAIPLQFIFFHPDCNCRSRNLTLSAQSIALRSRTFTAGMEFHQTPKINFKILSFSNSTAVNRRGIYCIIINYNYSMISETTPEPTVLPPSRIAKRRPFSQAMGLMSSTVMLTLSPGRHISTPSGSSITPVTSVVLK